MTTTGHESGPARRGASAAAEQGHVGGEQHTPANTRKYTISVNEVRTTSGVVEVEAKTEQEAEELAKEVFDFDACENETIEVTALAWGKVRESPGGPSEPEQGSAEERVALRVGKLFRVLAEYRDRDLDENLIDCLTDLMHWAEEQGLSFARALEWASRYQAAEAAGLARERDQARRHER